MAEITQEYAVDPLTGASIAVDPPLQQSETPLMGNSILTRRDVPRKGRSNTALYAGAALAVVAVLAGGAYLIASGNHHSSELMTTAATTPSAQQQVAAAPAPMLAPVATPAPRSAPIVAAADTRELPVRPIRMARAERAPARIASRSVHPAAPRVAAPAASENGTDTAVSVSPSQVAPSPSVATPQAAPAMTAPPPAPVVTPPPPAQ